MFPDYEGTNYFFLTYCSGLEKIINPLLNPLSYTNDMKFHGDSACRIFARHEIPLQFCAQKVFPTAVSRYLYTKGGKKRVAGHVFGNEEMKEQIVGWLLCYQNP